MSTRSVADLLAVVVNYNAGDWLTRCVTALIQSSHPLRVRVVDNASSDASLEGLRELQSCGQIEIEANRHNVGFGSACNQALAAAEEPYFLLVNPDCVVEPDTVAELRRALDGDSQAAIAGGLIVTEDGAEQRACRRRAPTLRRTLVTFLGLEALGLEGVNVRAPLPAYPLEMDAVSGALLCVRAAAFRAVGGFDEGYFLHCEDLDLFARVRAAGWMVLFVPKARALHAQGVSQRGRRLRAERYKHAGMVRYFRRHLAASHGAPVRWLWPLLIWIRYGLLAPAVLLRQWRETR